jgi:hypothetical protein
MVKSRDNLPVLTVTPEEFPLVFRGVSRTRLYEAIRKGEIRTIKDRKRRIIEIEEAKRWVRSLHAVADAEQDNAA